MTLTEQYQKWLAENDAGGSKSWRDQATAAHKKEKARLDAHKNRVEELVAHHQSEFDHHHKVTGDIPSMSYHAADRRKFSEMALNMKNGKTPSTKEIDAVLRHHKITIR